MVKLNFSFFLEGGGEVIWGWALVNFTYLYRVGALEVGAYALMGLNQINTVANQIHLLTLVGVHDK